MALELKQTIRLSQQLVMTPQLQQAIKLLQLSRMELVDLVHKELEENPVLEEGSEGDDEATPAVEAGPAESEAPAPETPVPGEGTAEKEPSDAEKIADIDWQSYVDAYPQTGFAEAREDDERPSFESTYTRRESLSDHLLWQLQLSDLAGEEREAASWIIGNLDDPGFLRSSVEDIARQSGVAVSHVETALAMVQTFDPTGVAARDLRECLLLQVDARGIDDPLVRKILDEHLDALTRRDFRRIARGLGVALEEVAAAARVIGSLEPQPARAFSGDDPIYIIPDIYVYKIGEEFHVVLNEDGLPKLRINNLYRGVLSGAEQVAQDTKEYVQGKVRSAMWLIKSIHQRQRTIYKVMQSIIYHQRDFFEKGINYLKPLNLRDVADDIEMHESTVSRVTTNKYVQIPQGIFELKYFFNSSINRVDGDTIASESVKDRIRRIITNEDPRRPLSDQRIAEMLKAANIDIARRTVTKYRELLNVLSSTKRRQVG